MTISPTLILVFITAYILGSIPSSVWIGRAFFGIDVREHGSGNAGATNTLRVLGKPAGIAVLIIDFMKGFTAANLVFWQGVLSDSPYLMEYKMALGACAVLGHIYPVFAGFRGGKGIATLIGVVGGMDWMLALACFISFIIIVGITRYISVGSMLTALISPLYAGLIHHWQELNLVYFCSVVGVLVVYTHRTNVKRLRDGNENRFSFNKKPDVNKHTV
ncbi:MAG: glycerol-3-phosphate 1-O-acyltransferase PlsY [Bacteroidia bacterium]|jgi:acyl phosphate:glycerol-3-phosphate acyltransferase|nr:glycerol-3-phosphate 1-O-acyltransferase PlsY [Bacteroidia bacterium]